MAGGRPEYEPTEADRNTVRSMASQGVPHETIALCLGKDGIDAKTMRKHFRRELDTAAAITNANIGTNVYNAAMRGEAWACCFWLKCRAGWKDSAGRGSDRNGGGKTVHLVVVLAGQPTPGAETASSPAISGQVRAAGKSRQSVTLPALLNDYFEGRRLVAFQNSGVTTDDSDGGAQTVFITVPAMPGAGGMVGEAATDSRKKSGPESEKPAEPKPGGRDGSASGATGRCGRSAPRPRA